MSMLPPAPLTPAEQQRRQGTPGSNRGWKQGVTKRVAVFIRQHPSTEYLPSSIAKHLGESEKSVSGSLSRLAKEGIVQIGAVRGYWVGGPNARSNRWESLPSNRVKPPKGSQMFRDRAPATPNGPTPARVRATEAQLHERDLMEVLRIRLDGRAVLIAEDGEIWVATHQPLDK